jgi:hypothetical protein
VDEHKTVAEEDLLNPGCWGRFLIRLDTFNRRFRPRCRRAVKSQVGQTERLFTDRTGGRLFTRGTGKEAGHK